MRLAALALALLCMEAAAQAFPSKPIRTLLTISGGADIVARLVAEGMSQSLGQPVVVETQSAAGGLVAAGMVMRAAPDGHMLLLSSSATQQQLWRDPKFDEQSLTPVTKAVDAILVMVANPSMPATLKGLVEHARRNPGKVTYSSSSTGGIHHLSGEAVRLLTGIDWLHVPYKGGTQALTDTIAGQVDVNFGALSTALPHVKSGKLRLLAINNARRYPVVPAVPTIAEELPGYQAPPSWLAYFGPGGMPPAIVKRLHGEITRILHRPDVRAKAEDVGFVVVTTTPEELAEGVKRDVALVNRIIEQAGIRLE